jgi:opacity protein-like surface antigen
LHSGYVTGVGVEHAFIGNWSAKLEYNYVNFRLQDVLATGMGNFNIPGVNVGVGDFPTRTPIRQELHLVKFGVNYHFNPGPGPVVAKY